eukprot:snap_masked-scaffold_12-processed-gene-10.33-mRNA-1 protein AED:0.22 eAED:0.22 QI:0/0/0/1/1/1/3/0/684
MLSFTKVQHTIADAQYANVLKNFSSTQIPSERIPRPSPTALAKFMQREKNRVTLKSMLESPLGTHFFKKYSSNFLNYSVVIEFCKEYWKLKDFEAPEFGTVEKLLELTVDLPNQFKEDVDKVLKDVVALPVDVLVALDLEFLVPDSTPRKSQATIDVVLEDSDEGKSRANNNGPINEEAFDKSERNIFRKRLRNRREASKKGESYAGYLTYFEPTAQMSEADITIDVVEFEDLFETNSQDASNRPRITRITRSDSNEKEDREIIAMKKEFDRRVERKKPFKEIFAPLGTAVEKKLSVLLKTFLASPLLKEFMVYNLQPVRSHSFTKYRDIGIGAFGVVSSVKSKTTGTFCALKCISKKRLKGQNIGSKFINNEKQILQLLGNNPSNFTIWLKYAYQDDEYYYLALPLCTGGDLNYHLEHMPLRTFSVEQTQFLGAEILEGLTHMHALGLIYRDLKPENIILENSGHSRISDMGLATTMPREGRTGKAGTPGYWAPEVLRKKEKYGLEADYFSLGALLYHLVYGRCPFDSKLTGISRDEGVLKYDPRIPSKNPHGEVPKSLRILLRGLLKKSPRTRYGSVDFKQGDFYKGFNWAKLQRREIPPPFVPDKGKIMAKKQSQLDYNKIERKYKNAVLEKRDLIPNFDYVSRIAHEQDIVKVLDIQKRIKPRVEKKASDKKPKKRFFRN